MLAQQGKCGAIQMKDEQHLHGTSPELSLYCSVVKSDLEMKGRAAENKSQHFQAGDERKQSQSTRTDKTDKSICVKPHISVWASANSDSCTTNIDSKIEYR